MASISQLVDKLRNSLPPLPTSPPSHEPSKYVKLQLAAIIGMAILMHFQISDASIAILALVIYLTKVISVVRGVGPPHRAILVVLTLIALASVVVLYGGWNGQRAGISFLVLLLALKFLESSALRDYFVVCLILYFLSASSFLFDSSIISILIITAYAVAITAILFQLSDPQSQSLKKAFKASANIVIRALPLALFLFFFFPRISGNFGFLPSQDNRESSALADSLVAGEMAISAFDNSRAFIAEFVGGEIPARQELYWRVKVMPVERDFTWELTPRSQYLQSNLVALRESASLKSTDKLNRFNYEILHEKSTDNFIPYLDYVSGYDLGGVLPDYSVYLPNALQSNFNYRGQSTLRPSLDTTTPSDMTWLLTTQSQPTNARILGLLDQWKDGNATPWEQVNRVLGYFQTQEFAYTLSPQALDESDRFTDFLLNVKEGYCEHYASAFTIIMRWLGIPSRVVVGYQGGTSLGASGNGNPVLEIRYRDAHAWSEVWIDGQWWRVDPTASISIERINLGMDAILDLWNSGLLGSNLSGTALANIINPGGATQLLRDLRNGWTRFNYQWEKWIVNYDATTQKELLSKLGFQAENHIGKLIILMTLGTFAFLLVYFYRLVPRREKLLTEQALYKRFLSRFRKFKLEKNLAETPTEFALRAAVLAPSKRTEIEQITELFIQLRYGERDEESLKRFKKLVNRFKLEREAAEVIG